ncbi:hypothetical protein E2C01_055953 [Portunus trituberculatus]|uniref:Uncharacterized protein n=1 Tax=Portunus trituberculatus TaxID=210409 RepID=A0A5B7GW35_PORTR|nr:hypothetical protein [Portunus trituberculatus]
MTVHTLQNNVRFLPPTPPPLPPPTPPPPLSPPPSRSCHSILVNQCQDPLPRHYRRPRADFAIVWFTSPIPVFCLR